MAEIRPVTAVYYQQTCIFCGLIRPSGPRWQRWQGQPVGVAELSQLADIDQGVHVVDEYIIVDGAVDFYSPSDTI